MSASDTSNSRRRFLTGAVGVVGGIGGVFTAVPFIASWTPSERAYAIGAPVDVDISKIEPGRMIVEKWQGKPVFIVNRPDAALQRLPLNESVLRDPKSLENQQPDYAQNEYRSRKPQLLVMIGVCTHLGCAPTYRPDVAPIDLGPAWQGGFFCPCHGSRFDLAGRVYQGVPAPTNLVIPPYKYLNDDRILIGDDQESA